MIRVMYIDDEPDLREVAQMALELDPELAVMACASGKEALASVGDFRPALVLLDVMMPEMDGPSVLAALRQTLGNAVKIVFITARASEQDRDGLMALGPNGVLAKPFDPMTLAQRVREFL